MQSVMSPQHFPIWSRIQPNLELYWRNLELEKSENRGFFESGAGKDSIFKIWNLEGCFSVQRGELNWLVDSAQAGAESIKRFRECKLELRTRRGVQKIEEK